MQLRCFLLISSFLSVPWCFGIDNYNLSSRRQKYCKVFCFFNCVLLSHLMDMFSFSLEMKLIFSVLNIWDYGQVSVTLACGQNRSRPWRERVQNSWQEAHVRYANIYGVTGKLKPHTPIYISMVPRQHSLMLCGRKHNAQDTQNQVFISHQFPFSTRESHSFISYFLRLLCMFRFEVSCS